MAPDQLTFDNPVERHSHIKPHASWQPLPGLDAETRLSQLARWCLDAAGESRSFGVRLPGTALPLGTGPQHLGVCLSALALFEAPGP